MIVLRAVGCGLWAVGTSLSTVEASLVFELRSWHQLHSMGGGEAPLTKSSLSHGLIYTLD